MKQESRNPGGELAPWPVVSSEPGPDLIIFQSRIDTVRSPRTEALLPRVILETPSWVNVVALTPEQSLVLVHQWRFGRRVVTTEIPGGVVDAGEEPLAAAQRELREETGYTSTSWSLIGSVEPNPAFHDNLCFNFLARDAIRTHAQTLDPGEDLEVRLSSLEDVRMAVRNGEIRHSLVICALARVLDLRGD